MKTKMRKLSLPPHSENSSGTLTQTLIGFAYLPNVVRIGRITGNE